MKYGFIDARSNLRPSFVLSTARIHPSKLAQVLRFYVHKVARPIPLINEGFKYGKHLGRARQKLIDMDRPSNSAQPTNAGVKDPGHPSRNSSSLIM